MSSRFLLFVLVLVVFVNLGYSGRVKRHHDRSSRSGERWRPIRIHTHHHPSQLFYIRGDYIKGNYYDLNVHRHYHPEQYFIRGNYIDGNYYRYDRSYSGHYRDYNYFGYRK